MEVKHGGEVLSFGKIKGHWFLDSRISLSVIYFDNEKDANLIAENVAKAGCSYNGGWFDGTPCGREIHRDYTDAFGIKWFAVTC